MHACFDDAHFWNSKSGMRKAKKQIDSVASQQVDNSLHDLFSCTLLQNWIWIIHFDIITPPPPPSLHPFIQKDTPIFKRKDTVPYRSPRSLTNVLNICRSMRLHALAPSAAPVRYLGHTPITARRGDELCRGNIFMECCHFFEYYFWSYSEAQPWSGARRNKREAAGEWQLGWLGLKVDLSSLYANAPAARRPCVYVTRLQAPTFFFFHSRWHHC